MDCKIVFSPQAIADLGAIVRHIAKDKPEAALRVGNALIDRVAVLEIQPRRAWHLRETRTQC